MNGQRKAIVTGATGYLGSHLARRLVRDGWEVHLIVRPSSSLALLEGVTDRVSIHEHDGSTEGMRSILTTANPVVVFHLASLFKAGHVAQDIVPLVASNILFGTQLLEAMAVCGVEFLVNTGTSWQHYENRDYSPVNLYAATKQAFEDILRFYAETTSIKAINLMLYDTYGPRDSRPKLFSLLRRAAGEGTVLAMSEGEQLLDLVYVDDVIQAYKVAAERLLGNGVCQLESFNVSSGHPVQLRDLVKLYAGISAQPLRVEWGGRPYRPREVMVPWNRGETLPGWKPVIGLEEGLGKMLSQDAPG